MQDEIFGPVLSVLEAYFVQRRPLGQSIQYICI